MKVALAALLIGSLAAGALRAQNVEFTAAELEKPAYKLLMELHEFGRVNRMLNVPPYDGRLLATLVRMNHAKNVLEVGTSNGVSSIWMALALKDGGLGRITTLEIDPVKVKLAGENFAKAGVSDLILIVEGDALKTLPKLEGKYDFVFIDAAKEQYKSYLDAIWDRIPSGGVIVAHNAVALASSMKDYLDYVQNHPQLDTIILRTGDDGVALSYKR